MDTARRRSVLSIVLWLGLIFVTSSFVVPFGTFVRFIQGLNGSEPFKQWFARFWGVNWFVIVKGWHATEYAVLLWLCVAGLGTVTTWGLRRRAGAALTFAVAFAASDEWHQTFVPGRDGCVRDVLVDSAGACLMAAFLTRKKQPAGIHRP